MNVPKNILCRTRRIRGSERVLRLKIRNSVCACDRTHKSHDARIARVHTHAYRTENLLRIHIPHTCPARGVRAMRGISASVVHDCSHTDTSRVKATRVRSRTRALKLKARDTVP